MIWTLPGFVAFVAIVSVFFAVRRVAGDTEELAASVVSYRELRQPLLELRAEALALKADALELQTRSPRGRPVDGPAS